MPDSSDEVDCTDLFRDPSVIVSAAPSQRQQRAHLFLLRPLGVLVAAVDRISADLRRRGIAVVGEATDQAWGARMAGLVDPDGNNPSLVLWREPR